MKKYLPIAAITIFAIFMRFVYLDKIPTALSGDELHYITTAKAVWLTGRDITGTWNPLSILWFRYPPNEHQAELPYLLHLVSGARYPFSLFLIKLPFAALSVGVVILLYAIAHQLFGLRAAIATGVISAINPWLIVMGRTGYEGTPATFFYLLALYLILRGQSVLWALIPLMLAFYSYIGTKLIFVPFICLAAFLAYKRNKKNIKQYATLIILSLLFTAFFVFQLKTSQDTSRIGELLLSASSEITNQVNEMRRTAVSSPLLPFTVNKYFVYVQTVTSKLFRVFSPSYLFVEGDQFFLSGKQGFFYYIDFLFLIIGSLALYAKRKFSLFTVWLFILIGTFPHLFHKTMGDFSAHLSLMFPFIIILIGAGIAQLRSFALWATILLYAAGVASFSLLYFSHIPFQGRADFHMRVLSRYLSLARSTNTPITVYSNTSGDLLTKYLFYSNEMKKSTIATVSRIQTGEPFRFNDVYFTPCDEGVHTASGSSVLIYDTVCTMNVDGPNVSISRLSDGGQLYKIFGDNVCSKYELTGYASGVKISDFDVEQLSEERFCFVYVHR